MSWSRAGLARGVLANAAGIATARREVREHASGRGSGDEGWQAHGQAALVRGARPSGAPRRTVACGGSGHGGRHHGS